METFKPVLTEPVTTNVNLKPPPAADFTENMYVFTKSLARLLDLAKEEKVEVPSPVTDPVEADVPVSTQAEAGVSSKTDLEVTARKTVSDLTLPTEAKALLDTLSKNEARDYNVIVGEGKYGAPATFEDYSKHPNIVGMRTVHGPSTAAGRYQIVYSTWKGLQKKYPGQFTDFSPVTQDRAAWRYAQDVYKERTGADLSTDLQAGNITKVQKAFKKIWIGFGLDKDVVNTYTKALERYRNGN